MDEEKPKFVARKAVGSNRPRIAEQRTSLKYRSEPQSITMIVGLMMWVLIAVAAAQFFLNLTHISAERNRPKGPVDRFDYQEIREREELAEKAKKMQGIQSVFGIVAFVVNVVAAVSFLMWVLVASSNSWGFAGGGLKTSPGWAVIWFLIPIANLLRPYYTMQEIWKVSVDPKNWKRRSDSKLITCWWAIGIVGVILLAIQYRLFSEDSYPPDVSIVLLFSILAFVQAGLLAWMTIRVTQSIVRNQDAIVGITERMRRRKPAPVSPPPPDSW